VTAVSRTVFDLHIPDNGLDSLNTGEQSIEMELAKALMKQ
jgi:hypothetical protein